ncbi:MAG: ABC transporter permease [Dehalococcoidia bacterium]
MALAADRTVVLPVAGRRSLRGRVSPLGITAGAILLLIALAALAGPRLWHWDPLAQQIDARLQNPSLTHPLGTDRYGRDILARLLTGARWTLSGALLVCAGVSLLGFAIGAIAASGNRLLDNLLGRLIESLMALPGLVTALAFTSVLGPSFQNLLVALVITSWPWYARAYRSIFIKERAAPYVEGAIVIGAGRLRLLLRHLFPNVLGPSVVLATGNLGGVMLGLAALSFLGLGQQPPTPEWGQMINDARPYFQRFPWQMVAPGACIALTVLAVNLAGDALRDALDPRSVQQRD